MKDLTILIQGPFFQYEQYNSNKNIQILKQNFPKSKIFISTWKNENKFQSNQIDKIIYNEDPGFIKDCHTGSATAGSNIKRQIISVKNGLDKIDTKYTLKVRSDCYFNSNKIKKINLDYYDRDQKYKIFDERIIISSLGSLNQKRTNILYHFNDWFNYGLTKDLKKIWNLKISENDINYFSKNHQKKNNILGKDWDLKYTAEQYIYFKSIEYNFNPGIEHSHDYSNDKLIIANKYLVNNFYLEDLNNVDFCFPKYDPKINKNLKKNMTNINLKDLINLIYNNSEWKKLYFNNTIN